MSNLIRSDENGFTLLEIMVAVAIMAIAFTAAIGLHSQSVTMNMASNFHTRAPLVAGKIIAQWETHMAVSGEADQGQDLLGDLPGFSYDLSEQEVESEWLMSENKENDYGKLIRLTCTVFYNDGEYQYTAQALKWVAP
jgi:general secretion pathway protein I